MMDVSPVESTNRVAERRTTRRARSQVGAAVNCAGDMTVKEAIDAFVLDNRAKRLAPKTMEFYRCQLTQFAVWCGQNGAFTLDRVGPQPIRHYLVNLEERGLRDTSIHAAARAIRAFLNFCVREEYIAHSPMSKVAMPRLDRRVLPAFSHADIPRLLRACTNRRDEALILFLLDTGCRAAEFTNLDGRDIDIAAGEVSIRQGKGRRNRVVFIGTHTQLRLLAYYDDRGTPDPRAPVWISQTRSERLTPSGLHQLLKRLGAQAGVAHCAPHTFRRTFAIWSLRNGMDLFRLARLMGHSDISVLRQYLYLVKADLHAAHTEYGTVDRLVTDQLQHR